MKRLTSSLMALAFASTVAVAGDMAPADKVVAEKRIKELEQAIEDQGIYVETSQKGIKLSGYVDTSYTYNTKGGYTSSGTGNAPGSSVGATSNLAGNNGDSNDFNVNAVKLALEKALPSENKLAAGFRIDLLMGEDWGNEQNLYIQQAYVTFRAPVGNGLDVKLGKMVTLLGLEVDERPANMNFSYGTVYTYGLGQAYDAGINLAYKFNDVVKMQVRMANTSQAWNTNADSLYAGDSDLSKTFTALLTLTPDDKKTLNIGVQYAGDSAANGVAAEGQVVVVDVNGTWSVTDKLTLGFDVATGFGGNNTRDARGNGASSNGYNYIALDTYAKYQFTDMFSLAGRFGYLNDQDGTAKLTDRTGFDQFSRTDLYSWTLTGAFNIWENLITRLEYRVDLLSAGSGATNSTGQNAFGSNRNTNHNIAVNVAYEF